MMITIYYNPQKQEYYAKIIKQFFSKEIEVGRKICYNGNYHELVCMFYLDNYSSRKPKLINCKSWSDYRNKTSTENLKEKYSYLNLE